MEQALDIAKSDLLAPAEIDEHHLQKVLSSLMVPGVDDAELYFPARSPRSMVFRGRHC